MLTALSLWVFCSNLDWKPRDRKKMRLSQKAFSLDCANQALLWYSGGIRTYRNTAEEFSTDQQLPLGLHSGKLTSNTTYITSGSVCVQWRDSACSLCAIGLCVPWYMRVLQCISVVHRRRGDVRNRHSGERVRVCTRGRGLSCQASLVGH